MRTLALFTNPIFLAVAAATLAVGVHWSLAIAIGPRLPYLFFLPAIIFVTVAVGRIAGLLTVGIGLINGLALQSWFAPSWADIRYDAIAAIFYVAVGVSVTLASHRHRRASLRARESDRELRATQKALFRQVSDLRLLHELSLKLPTLANPHEQLHEILRLLVRLLDAERGLMSLYDASDSGLDVLRSVGFSEAAVNEIRCLGTGGGACGLACKDRRRVVIEDTESDPRFESLRQFARRCGFRAVHSTPVLGQGGAVLAVLSVHFSDPTRPGERETALADICARKAAVHIERARAEEEVRRRDERFRTVLQASAVPFSILEPVRGIDRTIVDFRWKYLNAAASQVFAQSAAEVVGKRVCDVLPGVWDAPGLFARYVAVIERREVSEFEVRSTAHGISGWFHAVASPLEDSIAVWFADITGRKLQEDALREADRRKDEFLATLAHELRNPLAPIRQAAMIAGGQNTSEAQKRWSCSVIERQVQHMSLLLDDLLDVSRITRGRLSCEKTQPISAASSPLRWKPRGH